jgi:threonine dehydrogenase-like Zn-dependent dehydrogenase
MKGIFVTEKGSLKVLNLPEPEPGSYEAIVQVKACGICNSTDWKLIEGEFFAGTFPILLGHESVGEVCDVGPNVRHFRVGDLVLRSTLRNDHIPFPGGRSCWGGFVEKAIVTDVWAQRNVEYAALPHPQQVVPPGIRPEHAVAMIMLKETLSCLQNTDLQPGHSLAIVGTGPVAQALTMFAHLSGVEPVVVFGRRPEYAGRFVRLGATAYVAGEDLPAEVRTIMAHGGFDRVIEAVGSRQALTRCLRAVKREGRVNLYGIPPQSEPYAKEDEADRRVFRSKVVEGEMHEQLVAWIDDGRVRLDEWITHVLPWSEHRRAFEMIRKREANKVVLAFS